MKKSQFFLKFLTLKIVKKRNKNYKLVIIYTQVKNSKNIFDKEQSHTKYYPLSSTNGHNYKSTYTDEQKCDHFLTENKSNF